MWKVQGIETLGIILIIHIELGTSDLIYREFKTVLAGDNLPRNSLNWVRSWRIPSLEGIESYDICWMHRTTKQGRDQNVAFFF